MTYQRRRKQGPPPTVGADPDFYPDPPTDWPAALWHDSQPVVASARTENLALVKRRLNPQQTG